MSAPFKAATLGNLLLEAVDLACERDDRVLFSGLSFRVSPGDLLQIEGANGAGKTTLLRSLCGLMPLQQGALRWRGQDVVENWPAFRQDVLYLGHRPAIKPGLTALENLRFLHALRGEASEAEYWEALAKVGLMGYEESYCRNLSAGQQRRVSLAQLYLSEAPLWILDEIFTAIDKSGVAQFETLLRDRAQQGGMVIFTTHHHMSLPGLTSLLLGEPA